jgi:hypothetical protein
MFNLRKITGFAVIILGLFVAAASIAPASAGGLIGGGSVHVPIFVPRPPVITQPPTLPSSSHRFNPHPGSFAWHWVRVSGTSSGQTLGATDNTDSSHVSADPYTASVPNYGSTGRSANHRYRR